MAEQKAAPKLVITPEFVATYVNLEKPRAFVGKNGKPQGDPKYGFTALFDKSNVEAMKPLYAAAADVAKAKWPDIGKDELQAMLKRTFKDGDKEAARLMARKSNPKSEAKVAYLKGKVVVKATSTNPIDCSEAAAQGAAEILDWKKIYSGMIGKAELNFVAYDNSFGDEDNDAGGARGFITVYCNFFLKTKDGQRIGGRDRNSVWGGVQGGVSTQDPAGSDDIPF